MAMACRKKTFCRSVGLNEASVGLNEASVGLNEGRVGLNEGRVGLNEGRVGLNEGRRPKRLLVLYVVILNYTG